MDKEECLAEDLGRGGRYGCRCKECIEGQVAEAEHREER
jgi:hypothetical protein